MAYEQADATANEAPHNDKQELAGLSIVCPHCKSRSIINLAHDGWLNLACSHCSKSFQTLLATVRGKRSSGSRRTDARSYSVRVRHSGNTEELIEFGQAGYGDFELRSGDIVAFSFVGRHVIVTQNLSIGQFKVLVSTWAEILQGIIGIIVLGGLIVWFFS